MGGDPILLCCGRSAVYPTSHSSLKHFLEVKTGSFVWKRVPWQQRRQVIGK